MKPIIVMGMMLRVLGACGKNDDTYLGRQCGEYAVQMRFADDGAVMHAQINGQSVTLNNGISASGAKYDGTLGETAITLWGKGHDWVLILADGAPIECVAK